MEKKWRLISNEKSTVADLVALPGAIAEGKIAGRYILSTKESEDTLIIHRIAKKGLLVGVDVIVDEDEAEGKKIDVAKMSRVGRGGMRPAETTSLEELMLNSSDEFESNDYDDNPTAALIYTSGTTELPKGVKLTHLNFIAEDKAAESIIPTNYKDKFSSLVPFFHVFGLADGCVVPLLRGASIVLVPHYSPRKFLADIKQENITVILAIPDQFKHLYKAIERERKVDGLNIRYCISGADKLSDKIVSNFKEKTGIDLIEGYGMTETTAAVSINPPGKNKVGSIGVAAKGVEIKIINDKGKELNPFDIGEIIVKGDMITPGYFNNESETARAIKDGWLHTGDLGFRDNEGYFFITDRKKDIIIKSGFNISPLEIEKVICQYSGIRDAAAISFIKKNGKQGIRLFCVIKKGAYVTEHDIIKFCQNRLVAYKVPDQIVFVEKIPKSLTGKVLRKELRQGYQDQRLIKESSK